MNKKEVLDLVLAFAVVGILVGIVITIFAKEYTLASDIGMGTVVVSFIVTAICQIIILIRRRR